MCTGEIFRSVRARIAASNPQASDLTIGKPRQENHGMHLEITKEGRVIPFHVYRQSMFSNLFVLIHGPGRQMEDSLTKKAVVEKILHYLN